MIRPRRSLLFMPGSNARALEKARNLPADGIVRSRCDHCGYVLETPPPPGFPSGD